MHHSIFGTKLSRDTGQRQALIKGLAGAIVRSGAIETTEAKAKAAEGLIEKLITMAKRGHLSDIRQIESTITNRDLVHKLVHEIAPRFSTRPGGYLRLTKLGTRAGDNAPMVRMEFVTVAEKVTTPVVAKDNSAKVVTPVKDAAPEKVAAAKTASPKKAEAKKPAAKKPASSVKKPAKKAAK